MQSGPIEHISGGRKVGGAELGGGVCIGRRETDHTFVSMWKTPSAIGMKLSKWRKKGPFCQWRAAYKKDTFLSIYRGLNDQGGRGNH